MNLAIMQCILHQSDVIALFAIKYGKVDKIAIFSK